MDRSVLRTVRAAAFLGTALTSLPVFAQDATWVGINSNYDNPANWNPAGVPTGQATFGTTGVTTVLITTSPSVGTIAFAPGAPQHAITNTSNFTIDGGGIVNNTSVFQFIENNGTLTFDNGATVQGSGPVFLFNSSESAAAELTFNGGGISQSTIIQTIARNALASGTSQSGGFAATTFNGGFTGIGSTIFNVGGSAVAQGSGGLTGTAFGGFATMNFNDDSNADSANLLLFGGPSVALAGNGDAFADGGTGFAGFSGNAHANGATITVFGGDASAVGAADGSFAQAGGGFVQLSFIDQAQAIGATFDFVTGEGTAAGAVGGVGVPGGPGASGGAALVNGGFVSVQFFSFSVADGSTFNSTPSTYTAVGGNGGAGSGSDVGGSGGEAITNGGNRDISFHDDSSADDSTFFNVAGNVTATGGRGGDGGLNFAGGVGGAATVTSEASEIVVSDQAHIDNADITNLGSGATAIGGRGGDSAGAGSGGAGGAATATGRIADFAFLAPSSLNSSSLIANTAGNATATGGAGGDSTGPDVGGDGGDATSTGSNAMIFFAENSTAGSAVIVNRAGNATAIGGNAGATAGSGTGGGGGDAIATGGNAQINFFGQASAASARITNIGGTSSATAGTGAAGGAATATAGQAIVNFSNQSTAGQATFINDPGAFIIFRDSSTGGTSLISNMGGETRFLNASSAQGARVDIHATGTARFSDNATAGNSTLVNAGLLQFNDASLGGGATIANNGLGVVDIRDSADLVGATVLSVLGATIHIGSTTAGTRIGSLSGSGNVVLGARALQLGALNRNDSFTGVISGTGSLSKVGTGTLILSGLNTYTGATTISAGTLQLDGRITSNTTVAAGATLSGVGTVTGNVVNNGTTSAGTAASPFGTLTVSGNFTSNAGSFFVTNIHPAGTSDLLSAGTATLNGGTVRVSPASGIYPVQADFRILGTTSGRTGTFTGIDPATVPSFINASLVYTANDVLLRVRRTATNFALAPFLTPNQAAAAAVLDAAIVAANPAAFTTYAPVYNALLFASDAGTQAQLLSVVSGDTLTSYPLIESGVGERFNERLNSEATDQLGSGRRLYLWGNVTFANLDIDDDGNAPEVDSRSTDFHLGLGWQPGPDTIVGVSVGRSNSDVDIDSRFASGEVRSTGIGAYFRHGFQSFYVAGQLSYIWHDTDTERTLVGGGLALGSYDSKTFAAAGEIGMNLLLGGFSVEPHLRLKYLATNEDSYAETGGVGVLAVDSERYKNSRAGIGVRFVDRNPESGLRPYGLIAYEREFGDDRSVLASTLPGLGTFRVAGSELGKDILTARLGTTSQFGAFALYSTLGTNMRKNSFSYYALTGVRLSW